MQRIAAIQCNPEAEDRLSGQQNNVIGGFTMRTRLIAGTALIALVFGAAGALAGNLSPIESPYALLAQQTMAPQTTAPQPSIEGRSAYEAQQTQGNCHPAQLRIHGAWRKAQVCD
jgi:hypothetical protein